MTHEVEVDVGRVRIINRATDDASYALFVPGNVRTKLLVAGTEILVAMDSTGSFQWSFDDPQP